MRNGHRGASHAPPVHVHAHACVCTYMCACGQSGTSHAAAGGHQAQSSQYSPQPVPCSPCEGRLYYMRPPGEVVVALKLPPLVRAYIRIHTCACACMCMHVRACMPALRAPLGRAMSTLSLNVRACVVTGFGGTAHSLPLRAGNTLVRCGSFEGGQHARTLRFL